MQKKRQQAMKKMLAKHFIWYIGTKQDQQKMKDNNVINRYLRDGKLPKNKK